MLLEVNDLNVYYGAIHALQGISFTVNEGEIVSLIGVSAWYAPAAGVVEMVEAIIRDQKRVIPSAVLLNGQYGYNGLYIGVPAVLGAQGVERVIEMQLNDEEKAMLKVSADAVQSVVGILGY